MASESRSLVVCDAGPLIHLDELGCLDLLTQFNHIIVPGVVWEEVADHRPPALSEPNVPLARVDDIPAASRRLRALASQLSLDLGERHALRLMQRYLEATLLSDDRAARTAAQALNLTVSGTLGVITLSLETGRRTKRQVLRTLRNLPSTSTLHVKRQLLQTLINQVREAPS